MLIGDTDSTLNTSEFRRPERCNTRNIILTLESVRLRFAILSNKVAGNENKTTKLKIVRKEFKSHALYESFFTFQVFQ